MKIVLWSTFGLLALLWTGGAAALARLVQWSTQELAAGGGPALNAIASSVSVPAWLSNWIDPASLAAAQQAVADALTALSEALPAIGTAAGWLVPAVWVAWGLGLFVLVGVALAATWLMARLGRRSASGSPPD